MPKYTYILSFIVFCFLSVNSIEAQQIINQSYIDVQPSELLINDLQGSGGSAFIKQIGDDNEVELIQEQSNDAAINLTRVLQTGDFNVAVMQQSGADNQSILIQDGQDNYYQLVLEGTNNNTAIMQLGDNNSIIQTLVNSNNVNVELVQDGNNNEIIHILEGIQSRNYQIIQKGDNLKIEIRQSSY